MDNKRIEILLEEIKGDVKLVLEGHGVIRNEMHQMEQRLSEKIDDTASAVKFIAQKVNIIEKKLDDHTRQPAHI